MQLLLREPIGFEGSVAMKLIQVLMMGLASLYLLFAGFTALVGLFANGGNIWERALLSVVHPLGAIALIVLVFNVLGQHRSVITGALALLLVSIAGELAASVAIGSGVIKGDVALPLVFAVVPALGVLYVFMRGTGSGPAFNLGLGR